MWPYYYHASNIKNHRLTPRTRSFYGHTANTKTTVSRRESGRLPITVCDAAKAQRNTVKGGKTENMAMNEHERAGNPRAQWGANNLGNA